MSRGVLRDRNVPTATALQRISAIRAGKASALDYDSETDDGASAASARRPLKPTSGELGTKENDATSAMDSDADASPAQPRRKGRLVKKSDLPDTPSPEPTPVVRRRAVFIDDSESDADDDDDDDDDDDEEDVEETNVTADATETADAEPSPPPPTADDSTNLIDDIVCDMNTISLTRREPVA